jgi:hypothetical protein
MRHRATRPVAVVLLALPLFTACENDDPLNAPPLENEIEESMDFRKRTESCDSKYFQDLEDLSKTIATNQKAFGQTW